MPSKFNHRRTRWLPLMGVLLLLPGCLNKEWVDARQRDAQASAQVPSNYRAEIVALMRTYLNDPTNVRDAYVSQPELRALNTINRYAVCVRYNARSSTGGYGGNKESLVVFSHGRLDNIIDNARAQCKDAAYEPFPELQTMQRR